MSNESVQVITVAVTSDEDGDEIYEVHTPYEAPETFRMIKEWVDAHQQEMVAYYKHESFSLLDEICRWGDVMRFLANVENTLAEETCIQIDLLVECEDYYFEADSLFTGRLYREHRPNCHATEARTNDDRRVLALEAA